MKRRRQKTTSVKRHEAPAAARRRGPAPNIQKQLDQRTRELAEARRREPLLRPPPDAPLGRVATTKQVVHIADLRTTPSYIERNPFVVAAVELGGYWAFRCSRKMS